MCSTIFGAATVPEVKYRSSGSSARVDPTVGSASLARASRSVVALVAGLGGAPTTITWRSDEHWSRTVASLAAASSSTTATVACARSMRWAMSRAVHSVVAGIGITPWRNMPSSSSYHSGMRGSITNARSPARDAETLERVGDAPRGAREVAEADLAPALAARVERDQRELARMLRRPVLDDVARELVVVGHVQPERPARRLVVGHVHGAPMLSAGR